MPGILRSMLRPLTSDTFDAKAGQVACWLVSGLVLVLGFLKLFRLPLSETELFFGILLVLAVALLGVLIGLVLPIAAASKRSGALRNR